MSEVHPQPDTARSILADLIRQQRRLRSQAADERLLEANTRGIIYWRGQLERLSTESTPSTGTRHGAAKRR
jgi:hypothetical protein